MVVSLGLSVKSEVASRWGISMAIRLFDMQRDRLLK